MSECSRPSFTLPSVDSFSPCFRPTTFHPDVHLEFELALDYSNGVHERVATGQWPLMLLLSQELQWQPVHVQATPWASPASSYQLNLDHHQSCQLHPTLADIHCCDDDTVCSSPVSPFFDSDFSLTSSFGLHMKQKSWLIFMLEF